MRTTLDRGTKNFCQRRPRAPRISAPFVTRGRWRRFLLPATVCQTEDMSFANDEFYRLEGLIYRPVSTRPDWLKAWRNEAQYLLFLARRAEDDEDEELLQELEDQAREMADVVEARLRGEGLL